MVKEAPSSMDSLSMNEKAWPTFLVCPQDHTRDLRSGTVGSLLLCVSVSSSLHNLVMLLTCPNIVSFWEQDGLWSIVPPRLI